VTKILISFVFAILILFFIFIGVTYSSTINFKRKTPELIAFTKLSREYLKELNQNLGNEYSFGITLSPYVQGDFKQLFIGCKNDKQPNLSQAIEIHNKCLKLLIQHVNSSEIIRPFIKKYPADMREVGITIWFRYGGEVAHISNYKNRRSVEKVKHINPSFDKYEEFFSETITMEDLGLQ